MAVTVSPAFIGLAERTITPAEAPFGYGEVTIQEQGRFGFIVAQILRFCNVQMVSQRLIFVLWRVNSEMTQSSAETDETGTIQAQTYNRRPPCRRDADDFCGIGTPGEMRCPSLPSWMEQLHASLGRRVLPGYKSSFEAVTAQTGQSQVRCFSRAASRFRDDMLDGKRV